MSLEEIDMLLKNADNTNYSTQAYDCSPRKISWMPFLLIMTGRKEGQSDSVLFL